MKTWRGHINKTRKGEERLKCPFCNAADTKVIDSRPADDNSSIRRRRQCETCGKRFTTYEKLETIPLMVVKKDNTREMYDRAKIEFASVYREFKDVDTFMEELQKIQQRNVPSYESGKNGEETR